jgi:sRNA-binding regulator protein Hfq
MLPNIKHLFMVLYKHAVNTYIISGPVAQSV